MHELEDAPGPHEAASDHRGRRSGSNASALRSPSVAPTSLAPKPTPPNCETVPTRLADLADDLVEEMDFSFLFDRQRRLFSIGFNVTAGQLDASFYDALASEARLASFVAVALGQVPTDHWFKLGRSLTPAGGARASLSWSASMFEYFMPLLVMRDVSGHAARRDVPRRSSTARSATPPAVECRGASRSPPTTSRISKRNYQYRAFGVPGLGLKRGLGDDLVVAPYASILAAPLVAHDVMRNLERLARVGMAGRYGYYEAIDFTLARTPRELHRAGRRPADVHGAPPGHDPGVAR